MANRLDERCVLVESKYSASQQSALMPADFCSGKSSSVFEEVNNARPDGKRQQHSGGEIVFTQSDETDKHLAR